MRPRPKTLGFTSLLTLLAALYLADAAGAASVARQCREACGDEVAACVGAGGHPRACRRSVLGRCKREGVAACQGEALAPALAGSCSSPTVLPAQGGTFGGATSGTSALAGSCGSSGTAPEQVFQWTPTASGTATIQTCGAGTNFDTVLYMRSGACASGPEVAGGCNDDACTNATGLYRASRLTPSVTAGQTYFIVVDGYGGAQGIYGLTVTPPVGSPTTTTSTRPPTTTTTTTRPPTTTSTTTTTRPTTTTTTRPSTSTTTTARPPTTTTTTTTTRPPTTTTTLPTSAIRTVFLIVMENTDWSSIKGSSSAPYINSLLSVAAHAEQYYNPPNNHPSLPNYLWLEAGTNFGISSDPNPPQRTSSPHLATMLDAAGISWKTYQEDEGSGAYDGSDCPNYGEGNWYDVNHNPFVYFTDVTNNTTYCKAHVRPYSEFPTDLASNNVPRYNFIVPDLCHDMHENISCSQSNRIRFGDTWLSTEVPKILASPAYLNGGALFLVWDEAASNDGPIGMIVLSPKAKRGYSNSIAYDHGSTLRTLQEIFGVTPMLRGAATATDLSDLFVSFP